MAVNEVTDKIYVGDEQSDTVTMVDGASQQTQSSLPLGLAPLSLAVNPVTNTVYATLIDSFGATEEAVIDGQTNEVIVTLPLTFGVEGAVNSVTNRTYVNGRNRVFVISGAAPPPLRFIPVTPCRVADTRNTNGTFGGPALQGGASRDFPIPQGACNIPSTAAAYSLNVTVVPQGPLGFLTMWPSGQDRPLVSTLNSLDGRIKANAAVVAAGANQAVSLYPTQTTNVILDINGYFVPARDPNGLAFYPLTPCRVIDTRGHNGPLGGPNLTALQTRDFPVRSSNCNIPANAEAYSLNFAVVPTGTLSFLTAWPSDQQKPLVSTLNDLTGTIVANAAVVPAAANDGDINVFVTDATALVVDINGYFAPPTTGGLSLYAMAPCRVLDTRFTGGAFSGQLTGGVNVVGPPCSVNNSAQAYVFNATVLPQGPVGYLTLWPDTETQPNASTLNALDGAITNNMAIVPTLNGKIDAFISGRGNLILDISGFFAP